MRLLPICLALLLLFAGSPAPAAQKTVTLYLDGARVEQEAAAPGGYLEFPLPDGFTPGSLRVKPLGGGSVARVELAATDRDPRRAREIARLKERISELEDRMQALSRQEEIFAAAVKAQSGKAPRKSKTNPDPVASLQRGTEFALSQLEAVYRGKRKCRRSLDSLGRQLAAARKGGAVARVWLSGGRVRISYLISAQRWTPSYAFRFAGDTTGELLLHAKLAVPEKGAQYLVSIGTVAQSAPGQGVRGDFPTLARYPLTLTDAPRGAQPPLSFAFGPVEAGLPPGEAAAFWRGEYLGSGRFAGGDSREFSLSDSSRP